MKKIIGLTIAVLLIIGLVGGGTFAYFSDTETSTGNTLTAGTLNLQVGAADPVTDKVTLANIKPTDSGNAAIWLTICWGSGCWLGDVFMGWYCAPVCEWMIVEEVSTRGM